MYKNDSNTSDNKSPYIMLTGFGDFEQTEKVEKLHKYKVQSVYFNLTQLK